MGKVTFVGAGPYDARFLTLAAQTALMQADCILYDHLLDEHMLDLTHGECIYVGKKGHHLSISQTEINALLIEKANQFDHVVRLKGGDSFVFGRGGEEALALHHEHISYTFIPGITSAVAVAEMAGIPITHRGIASGFLVLSAHLQNHALSLPLEQLRNPDITLLFLMGNSRIEQIVEALFQAGRDAATPIAIISQGCSPNQYVVEGTLASILKKVQKKPTMAPAIIVVGAVVALRKHIQPAMYLPLQKQQILVYKMNDEPSRLAQQIRELGAVVKEVMCGRIQSIHVPFFLDKITPYDGYIFSSKHAIHSFFQQLNANNQDARFFAHRQFVTIGSKTAEVLDTYGIKSDFIADGTHEGFIKCIQQMNAKKTLYLKGNEANSLFLNEGMCDELIVYENIDIPSSPTMHAYDAICFTSASAVTRCPYDLREKLCVSIGKTTTKALRKRYCKNILEASSPSYEAMVKCLCQEVDPCIAVED